MYIYVIKRFWEVYQLEYTYNREKYFYSRIQKKNFSIYSIYHFACDSCDTWGYILCYQRSICHNFRFFWVVTVVTLGYRSFVINVLSVLFWLVTVGETIFYRDFYPICSILDLWIPKNPYYITIFFDSISSPSEIFLIFLKKNLKKSG